MTRANKIECTIAQHTSSTSEIVNSSSGNNIVCTLFVADEAEEAAADEALIDECEQFDDDDERPICAVHGASRAVSACAEGSE